MTKQLLEAINLSLKKLNLEVESFAIEHPADMSHGDYSTNVAMVAAKVAGANPRELAQKIVDVLEKEGIDRVEKIEIAGPGFINLHLSKEFFGDSIHDILKHDDTFGKNTFLKGDKIMMEFTDPNPFKQFHIGHLMSNTIGESLSRILEWNGAKVVRANYQGDVGLHVAKAIYGMEAHKNAFPHDGDDLDDKVKFLGDAYVYGATEYEDDASAKEKMDILNKQIFDYLSGDKSAFDENVHVFYTKGREWSLEHFEEIYKKLGTSFNHYFFESDVAEDGLEIVEKYKEKGVFAESDGAIVFKGEDYGLHTRVFVNSKGVPTYEAKDLGLAFAKEKKEKCDQSVIITAVEQKEYMNVVYKAVEMINPDIAEKTEHISHGMMRFKEGKMSSRTGNVITGESLLHDLEEVVEEKMRTREISEGDKKQIASQVAVGALKYSILRQSPGKDIAFDREQALSFEGDSGPYLQYTYVRTNSLLEKAKKEKVKVDTDMPENWEVTTLEKMLYRLSEVIALSYKEEAPQYIVTYLTEVAGEFNSFYANNQIVSSDDDSSGYKLAITEAVGVVLKNGLHVLGIETPTEM